MCASDSIRGNSHCEIGLENDLKLDPYKRHESVGASDDRIINSSCVGYTRVARLLYARGMPIVESSLYTTNEL